VPMFLSERYHLSRAFAGNRVAGSSPAARLGWAAGAILLPFVLVARAVRNVWRRPQYLRRFIPSFPLVVLFSFQWAVGELVGYLIGPGDSMVRIR